MIRSLAEKSHLPQWFREAALIAAVLYPPMFGIVTWKALKLLESDQTTSIGDKKEQKLLYEVTKAESFHRGYILTGNEKLLTGYWRHVWNAQDGLLEVSETLDGPNEKSLVKTQEKLIKEKIQEMNEVLDLARHKGFASAQGRIFEGSGIQIMDDIDRVAELITIKHEAAQRRSSLGW